MADPKAGISNTVLIEPFDEATPDPWWKMAVTAFRRATSEELPAGYRDGYVVEVPLIETPIYMDLNPMSQNPGIGNTGGT